MLDEATALFVRTLSKRLDLRSATAATQFLNTHLAARWEILDRVETLRRGPELKGVLLLTHVDDRPYRSPERELVLLADPEDVPVEWIASKLAELEPLFGEDTYCVLEPVYPLVPQLRAAGFGLAKLALGGRVRDVLGALDRRAPLDVDGLEFAQMVVEDVDFVIAQRSEFFRLRPELGFGSLDLTTEQQAKIDAAVRDSLLKRLAEGLECSWVIRSGGERLGAFGLSPYFDHPIYGNVAGIDVMLEPEIQGNGVGRAAYATMMKRAAELQIENIRGTTSNPAVVHMAVGMNRQLNGWFFRRRGPYLPATAFDYPHVARS